MFEPARSQDQKRHLLPGTLASNEPKQRRLMLTALALLLMSLVIVLYRERDFWFPDSDEVADQFQQPAPSTSQTTASEAKSVPAHQRKARSRLRSVHPAVATRVPAVAEALPNEERAPLTVTRTVLPPLEVEVVAGSTHRTLRPGTNSVKVDMQPEENATSAQQAPIVQEDLPASITVNAAEHTAISAEPAPADVVSHSVQPGYPMLAREMKVQGAVTLQALIGRDGLIQDLKILAGPPILAKAALEAVKQWHFKPHYEGTEPVETQAKITVNFTISTN
ncbi:MAG: energy transducer TonB [Candidatus Sulfotelmatobacter sp.]